MIAQFSKKPQGLVVVFFMALIVLMAGCERKKDEKGVLGFLDGLISNRATAGKHFIAVIKLQSPALFAGGELKSGKVQVEPSMFDALEAEQKAFLADLAAQAPDVKVIFRYRFVLNGFTVTGKIEDLEKLKALGRLTAVETDGGFLRPVAEVEPIEHVFSDDLKNHNSVKFIGAENLFSRKVKDLQGQLVALDGTGMKVGVIDTGIDYTHAMLGGPGTEEAYKTTNPKQKSPLFPNKKVVAGTDLAGTDFNAAALDFEKHIPQPDENPLDEGGHGTHVAGTIAGIGDMRQTYEGVAQGADLYAIKVFGEEGSTSDSVVIAGLEYAADPNQDQKSDDHLDVVNLSLGSSFGSAKILYSEAIRNLTRGGTVVVASAGNAGNVDYITGAPAVADEAISVAASIDDTLHNWQSRAVQFLTISQGAILAEAIEGSSTKPLAEILSLQGKLVYGGLADQDFSPELAAKIKGNVAFLDRGKVAFVDKIKRAVAAGAVGVVVANNQPGEAFVMGGDVKFDIPGIMITLSLSDKIKAEMVKGDVVIDFKINEKILKPHLIDTITGFSSKGPRSVDALIKPEISAPGSNIISAAMGGGTAGVKLSGTSMAGPHIAGAMALLKQAHPMLSVADLKTLLMNRAKTLKDVEGKIYPISRQGSGRVQIDLSVDSKVLLSPAAISLGEVGIETRKAMTRTVRVQNMTQDEQVFSLAFEKRGLGIELGIRQQVRLAAGEQKELPVRFVLDATTMKETVREMDGWLVLTQGSVEIARAPVLAVARKLSFLKATGLTVESGSTDSAGATASIKIENSGKNAGEVMLFNLLAIDQRKQDPSHDKFMSKDCDLQSVGYRIITKQINGKSAQVLQIAAKLYEPLTHWNSCEVTVLVDGNGDQLPEQELAAVVRDNVPGLSKSEADQYELLSTLFDASILRDLRKKVEEDSKTEKKKVKEDYSEAVLSMIPQTPMDHTTMVIIEADTYLLARRPSGELAIKVIAQDYQGSAVETDDFLATSIDRWIPVSLDEGSQSFVGLPEKVSIAAESAQTLHFTKGFGSSELMALYPNNLTVFSDLIEDQQQELLKPSFLVP